MNQLEVRKYQEEYSSASAEEIIQWTVRVFPEEEVRLSSSLGLEDQVLTHMLQRISPNTKIFTLDTGRLPEETYKIITDTSRKYAFHYEILFPDRSKVEKLLNTKGTHSFYDSIENRKECCSIRKVEPLRRKLSGLQCWICGLRKDQSTTRQNIQKIEWDDVFGLVKINPLIDWSLDEIWKYVKENDIPYNALHDQGYPSLGCAPCTRAIKSGDDIRAGRWWWETPEHKECGLHIKREKTLNDKG